MALAVRLHKMVQASISTMDDVQCADGGDMEKQELL